MRRPTHLFQLISAVLLAACDSAPELATCEPTLPLQLGSESQPSRPDRLMPPGDRVTNLWSEELRPVLHLVDCSAQVSGPEPTSPPPPGQPDEPTPENATQRYAAAPAGVESLQLGIMRPGWFVNDGGSVRIALHVPAERPELRWHDGASTDGGQNLVRIIDEQRTTALATSRRKAGWKHRSVSLDRWAGRRVVVELSASGAGVGFFGDPRVLSARRPSARQSADTERPTNASLRGAPPGILVYLIDSLRPDHIAAWDGDARAKTPVLNRLARKGVMFGRAISASPWTKPSLITLMTGISPTTHRVGAQSDSDRLPSRVETLQGRLREAGWRTGSFAATTLSGLAESFGTTATPGLWRGRLGRLGAPTADQLQSEFLAWLQEEPDQPSFAYIHALEVTQYESPVYHPGKGQGQKAATNRYRAAVTDADRKLGHLLNALEVASQSVDLSRWLVVVASLHGESLGERGLAGHGSSLDQSQIAVPLIFFAASLLEPGRIDKPVGLFDLAPTLLDLAGLPPLPEADGVSLKPYLEGNPASLREFVAAALLRPPHSRPQAGSEHFALISADLGKVLRTPGQADRHLDLAREPLDRRIAPPALDAATSSRLDRALDDWLLEQARAAEAFRLRHGEATVTERP